MSLKSILLTVAISILGYLICSRMLLRARSLQLISEKTKRSIFLFFISLILFLSIFFSSETLLVSCFALSLFPIALMCAVELVRLSQFEKAALEVLNNTILQMKSGQSFKESLEASIDCLSMQLKFYFFELMSHLLVENAQMESRLNHAELNFLHIILEVHRSPNRQIDKLMTFRLNEKLKNRFRLKSRQMTAQVRAQAGVLSLMYVSLAIFQLSQEPRCFLKTYFWFSMLLVSIGVVCMHLLLRRFRWKT